MFLTWLLRGRVTSGLFYKRSLSQMATGSGSVRLFSNEENKETESVTEERPPSPSSPPHSSSSSTFSKEDTEDYQKGTHSGTNQELSIEDLRAKILEDLKGRSFAGTPFLEHSKNAQRRLLRLHVKKHFQKKNRKEKAENKRQLAETDSFDKDPERLSKRLLKIAQAERMREAKETGQRVAIDCSLEEHMSPKQLSSLARQIRFLYSQNVRCTGKPFHLHLSGLEREGKLYQALSEQFTGFERVIHDVMSTGLAESFPKESIVYLSPDSPNTLLLHGLDPTKVYVIGGLVDLCVKPKFTYNIASNAGFETAKLPIDAYLSHKKMALQRTNVLTIDQVFNILLEVGQGKSWFEAFDAWLPTRKGFIRAEPEASADIA